MEEKIKEMLERNEIAVIYAEDGKEESAKEIADALNNVVAIAEFKNEKGDLRWGVLIDKTQEMKVKLE